MKRLLLLSMALFATCVLFAQVSTPKPPNPKEIKPIFGAMKNITKSTANTKNVLYIYCDGNRHLICMLRKQSTTAIDVETGDCRAVGDADYASIYGHLDESKSYIGVYRSGGVQFYEVNSATIPECSETGATVEVVSDYELDIEIE